MKTFEQLTMEQQEQAISKAMTVILEEVVSGAVRFNDALNGDDLQARIDAAFDKAEQMRTPWFAHEYIMDTCADDIRAAAIPHAQDAIYLEGGEYAVNLL